MSCKKITFAEKLDLMKTNTFNSADKIKSFFIGKAIVNVDIYVDNNGAQIEVDGGTLYLSNKEFADTMSCVSTFRKDSIIKEMSISSSEIIFHFDDNTKLQFSCNDIIYSLLIDLSVTDDCYKQIRDLYYKIYNVYPLYGQANVILNMITSEIFLQHNHRYIILPDNYYLARNNNNENYLVDGIDGIYDFHMENCIDK